MPDGMHPSVAITGGAGLLGLNWAVAIRDRARPTLLFHRRQVQIDRVDGRIVQLETVDGIRRALDEIGAEVVIHTAALTSVETCESEPALAHHVNVSLAENVATACALSQVKLVHVSTDHLFADGSQEVDESHPVAPVNAYGSTKAEAEVRVLDAHPTSLVVRTNFYGWGPSYRASFSDTILSGLRARRPTVLFDDVTFTPILIEVLVGAVGTLIDRGASGIFHVVGDDCVSKFAFGVELAATFGLDAEPLRRGAMADRPELVRRPRNLCLSNAKATAVLGRPIGGIAAHLPLLRQEERRGAGSEIGKL